MCLAGPSPAARPFTKTVLPAPSGPIRLRTSPPSPIDAARAAAAWEVASIPEQRNRKANSCLRDRVGGAAGPDGPQSLDGLR